MEEKAAEEEERNKLREERKKRKQERKKKEKMPAKVTPEKKPPREYQGCFLSLDKKSVNTEYRDQTWFFMH